MQGRHPRPCQNNCCILGHARQLIPNMKIVRQKAYQVISKNVSGQRGSFRYSFCRSARKQAGASVPCSSSVHRGQMKWMETGGRRGYSFGVLKIEAMPQLALCNSRSLRQAPARKKWNSSLPWTGFWKDITSIYCSNLRYFTTSGKMDAKGTNAWQCDCVVRAVAHGIDPTRMLLLMGCGAGWGVSQVCFRHKELQPFKDNFFSLFWINVIKTVSLLSTIIEQSLLDLLFLHVFCTDEYLLSIREERRVILDAGKVY